MVSLESNVPWPYTAGPLNIWIWVHDGSHEADLHDNLSNQPGVQNIFYPENIDIHKNTEEELAETHHFIETAKELSDNLC